MNNPEPALPQTLAEVIRVLEYLESRELEKFDPELVNHLTQAAKYYKARAWDLAQEQNNFSNIKF